MRIKSLLIIAVVLFMFYCLDTTEFMTIYGDLAGIVNAGLNDLLMWLS